MLKLLGCILEMNFKKIKTGNRFIVNTQVKWVRDLLSRMQVFTVNSTVEYTAGLKWTIMQIEANGRQVIGHYHG